MDKHLTIGGSFAAICIVTMSLTGCVGGSGKSYPLLPTANVKPTSASPSMPLSTQPPTSLPTETVPPEPTRRTVTVTVTATPTPSIPSTRTLTAKPPMQAQSPTVTPTEPHMTANPPSVTKAVNVYYVAPTIGAGVGCGVTKLVSTGVPLTYLDRVKTAMTSLVLHRTEEIGASGLHNALYQSKLQYVKSQVNSSTVKVWLTGTVKSPGICADPQIIDQLEHTAFTAAGVTKATVYVNGKTIASILSTKG